jgi:hypothetical protein
MILGKYYFYKKFATIQHKNMKNQKIMQLLADALIPVLGFFWWNWSLYFIVLFYLLDYTSNEAILHFKAKKIAVYQGVDKRVWLKKGLVSFLLFICAVALIHLAMRSISPNIQFLKELISFWNYKDMGIEQGYILFPLIAIVGYQRFKMEFILPKRFQKITMLELWKPHLTGHLILIGSIAFVIGLGGFIILPEAAYIIGIVIISSVYQLTSAK